ncbi:MAG: hypothetical protein Kow00121_52610 [Elainellaceae cyanobacterium]
MPVESATTQSAISQPSIAPLPASTPDQITLDSYRSEMPADFEPTAQSTKASRFPDLSKEFQVFLSTFLTIFLAELGDKTQVTTLLISAESHSPWVVFAGAGSALVATSLVGVWLGHWLSKRISARTLEVASATILLVIAVLLLWDVAQG